MDNNNELTNAINQLATSLEKGTATEQQQENFLTLAEQTPQYLSEEGSKSMSSSFLAILISIISMKTHNRFVIRAIKLLHLYLQNDPTTFKNFKPNKPLLRKMDLSNHMMS